MSYELTHDYLTGLPNRTLLTDRLTEALISSHHNNRDVGVIHCNVDRFKYINDTLGHGVGDGVLQGITARLRSSIRENDTLYRLGADEFIIVIENVQHKDELLEIAQRIKKDFSFPFCFADHELKIDCSMGIALSSLAEENPTNLLKCAESALRHAKDSGLGSYCFYIDGMEQENMKQAEIENQLKAALLENEFQLHYQPIVDLRAGKLVGVEALLRWTNSQLGSISPAEFIPIAERSGLIIPIGEWIINTVKDQLLEWEKLKIDLFVSMNVSSIQLKNPDFLDKFCHVISENKLNPAKIELELTESILLEQSPHITESLAKLRSLGIRISLDDFGTGYSSLTYLQRFPLNKIKIERSFITNIETQKDSQAIVSAIVAMAHKLDLEVVAEGIERPSTVGYLKQMSIDYLQGYYFSPPVVADSITQLVLGSKVESLLMAVSSNQQPNIQT
ncbi:putative bifunctional diguanylate cyclase/phosphodiesterase [Candidatus Odyssella thessalonicensis]|uniref:putative bifunctional diguanylate cyclase/phosphodiesterase n=1 Tax=Candidatus Odyssella thessalonicensis TaxID=84647 RepID=UPI0024786A46|nr:EAL domain-containing protein [Candidatus Odyssella thessalonicensis]